jgi:hypothetical protein
MRSTVLLILVTAGCIATSGCIVGAESFDTETLGQTEQALATDVVVYSDTSLASPWQNWSWSASAAFGNVDTPRTTTASTSQIKTTLTGAWGALSLARASGNLPVADYDSVTFDIRGTASQTVYLLLETLAGAGGSSAAIPVTTTWSTKTIKLSALKGSLTSFGRVEFIGPSSGQTFYVDNIKLVAAAAPPQSPTFPVSPLAVAKNNVVNLAGTAGPYSVLVPDAYDAAHNTPSKVLLWMHGCGGDAYGDAWVTSPRGTQSWITVSVGGRDGQCWDVNTDTPLVLGALEDVKKRLNIDPKRVVLGGYSSGGDMAYRVAFYNASKFAGVIAENTAPFRDTGSTQAQSIPAAAWKFNVAHLAHLGDLNYKIDLVRAETNAMTAAGFPLVRLERAGTHWDYDNGATGTAYDLRTYLLPYLDAGWIAP